jgi:hypothetical protein
MVMKQRKTLNCSLNLFSECRDTSADISWDLTEHNWDDNDELQYRIILGKILFNKSVIENGCE